MKLVCVFHICGDVRPPKCLQCWKSKIYKMGDNLTKWRRINDKFHDCVCV